MIQRTVTALFAAAAVSFATGVNAVPIPVASSSASDLIFSFDFTSSLPYSGERSVFQLNTLDVGETITVDAFNGPAGTGGVAAFTFNGPGSTFSATLLGLPGVDDGIFSIGFRLNTGAADLTNFTQSVTDRDGGVISSVTVVPADAAAPEPATLALLGLGLAGIAASRRRKLN